MNKYIVGTAGHIDHGKTSLIKYLTGVDTDTLKEEKERGITVNLGFTNLQLDENTSLGVVDVPGHENLIKNMLAGIYGLDLVLLVVACDDGIMPQTKEHFEIIKFLNLKNILVVLTKTDLVSNEQVELIKNNIEKEFNLTEFVKFSIYDKQTTVKAKIVSMLKDKDNDSIEEEFRMSIDRVFNIKGFGVIVTGTSISGEVKIGDSLVLKPGDKKIKVRGIQVHNKNMIKAKKRTRVALNLTGIKQEDVKRGYLLLSNLDKKNSNIIDVKITTTQNSDYNIKHLNNYKLYYLAKELDVRVKLINQKELKAGETTYAQILLKEDEYFSKGDFAILRNINPKITVAGLEIINASGEYVNRKNLDYAEKMKQFEFGSNDNLVEVKLKGQLCIHKNILLKELELDNINSSKIIELNSYCFLKDNLDIFIGNIEKILKKFHQDNLLSLGINKSELLKNLGVTIPNKVFTTILKYSDKFESTNLVRLKAFEIKLDEKGHQYYLKLVDYLESEDFRPPKIEDCLAKFGNKDLFYSLIKLNKLIKIDNEVVITNKMLKKLINRFDKFYLDNKILKLNNARDLLNTSRKYVISYLEYFDKIGYTKRVEEGREKK